MLYLILKHAHSGLRWIVLLFLLAVIINAFRKFTSRRTYSTSDRRLTSLTMSFTHLQLLIGIALFFISPKVIFSAASMKQAFTRFYLVEHSGLMLLAIALITIGAISAKRAQYDRSKHLRTLIYFSIALIVILGAIPWPFQMYGSAWF